jgi:hypothetical protein
VRQKHVDGEKDMKQVFLSFDKANQEAVGKYPQSAKKQEQKQKQKQ